MRLEPYIPPEPIEAHPCPWGCGRETTRPLKWPCLECEASVLNDTEETQDGDA